MVLEEEGGENIYIYIYIYVYIYMDIYMNIYRERFGPA